MKMASFQKKFDGHAYDEDDVDSVVVGDDEEDFDGFVVVVEEIHVEIHVSFWKP